MESKVSKNRHIGTKNMIMLKPNNHSVIFASLLHFLMIEERTFIVIGFKNFPFPPLSTKFGYWSSSSAS